MPPFGMYASMAPRSAGAPQDSSRIAQRSHTSKNDVYATHVKTPGDNVEFQMAVGEVWVMRNGQWLIRAYSGTLMK